MQSFGTQSIKTTSTIDFNTGMGYQYLQVINQTPYVLNLNFVGQGSMSFPNWFLQDIPLNQSYRGSLIITASNPYGLSQIISNLVTVNAWSPGELDVPQALSLSQTTGNIIYSLNSQQIYAGVQAVNNSSVAFAAQTGFTGYLKGFLVTGDKSAAVSTGELEITGQFNGQPLWYFLNQNSNGTVPLTDTFDPPVQASPDAGFVFHFPNLAAGLDVTIKGLIIPTSV